MYGVVKALPVGATQKSTAVARFDTRLANRTSAPPPSAASAEEESVAAESVASARVESAIEGESDPASVPVSGATSGGPLLLLGPRVHGQRRCCGLRGVRRRGRRVLR